MTGGNGKSGGTGNEGAFRVLLRMEINPGLEADFEKAWRGSTEAVTGPPACLGQWLSKDTAEESVYFIVSDWTDEPGFREFESSDAHLAHRERLHPYRGKGSFNTMRVVAHVEGKAASHAA
ncbi:antibiotic biosynthesis monooxygenase [Streptomyces lunaelactis]|uniref:antibiotic biosynthesis monooxygenase family protein n=1 Tax=Streptomyces lunaelactis TaxID=1535768 RepID=UPI0015859429|nr:antibiotic biosynthesis monooxygenase family protein [Streptomyces lunaelactis]NUK33491.1 antibiotic biosynthesis monooxygenase [Streptomyces lunaelactis]